MQIIGTNLNSLWNLDQHAIFNVHNVITKVLMGVGLAALTFIMKVASADVPFGRIVGRYGIQIEFLKSFYLTYTVFFWHLCTKKIHNI